MSASNASIVASTGATVKLTFTPQPGGIAALIGASKTVLSVQSHELLTIANNETSFLVSKGDFIIGVVLVDSPNPETGTFTFSVNGGPSTTLISGTVFDMPGGFLAFGL